jgi:hypothetical protein
MMKKLLSTVVATVVIVAPAQAQQGSQVVKVDGKDYTVTEMLGRTMHMVQLSGPEGSAMISVNNQNQITMYASPPGGGTPSQKSMIDNVWKAYVAQKTGNAAANTTTSAGGTSDDPNAALRAQSAAVQAQAQARANGAPVNGQQAGPITYEFPASGGAIAHGTPYGDIVFNADATEAHFTRTSRNALAGNTSQTWSYQYVGQKNKAGATAKGIGGAVAGAMNVRHAGRVDEGGIEVYLQTNGGKKEQEYGTEQETFAVNPNVGHPLDNGVRQLAIGFLDAAKEALKGATQAAKEQNIQSFHPDDAVATEFDKWKHQV